MSSLDPLISNITAAISSAAADFNLTNSPTIYTNTFQLPLSSPTSSTLTLTILLAISITLLLSTCCYNFGSPSTRTDILTLLRDAPTHELHAKVYYLCDEHLSDSDLKNKIRRMRERKIMILERIEGESEGGLRDMENGEVGRVRVRGDGLREEEESVELESGMGSRRYCSPTALSAGSRDRVRGMVRDKEVSRLLAGYSDRVGDDFPAANTGNASSETGTESDALPGYEEKVDSKRR
ncbi:hypothetical protein DL98DRAFT_586170 [Cadophora sp. DSE1049]|nr:hypothetical protein DL98DRAFT_586170 [Cadophora sp. DSE1049]